MVAFLKPLLIIILLVFTATFVLPFFRRQAQIKKLFYFGVLLQLLFVGLVFLNSVPLAFSWAYVSQALVVYLLTFNLYLLSFGKGHFQSVFASGFNIIFLIFALFVFQPLYLRNYVIGFEHLTFRINVIFKAITFALTLFQLFLLTSKRKLYSEKARIYSLASLIFWLLTMLTYSMWGNFAWGRYWSWDVFETQFLIILLLMTLNVYQSTKIISLLNYLLLFIILILIAVPMLPFLYQGHGGYA